MVDQQYGACLPFFPSRYFAALALAFVSGAAVADDPGKPFAFNLQVWDLAVKNLDTGPDPHHFGNSGNLFVGVDADLERLVGVQGASMSFLYVFFPWMHGDTDSSRRSWQSKAGSYFAGAPFHNDIDSGYLARFTWNQTLMDGRLQLVVGRSNAKQHFYLSNCNSVVTCNDPILDNSTGVLPYPYGSWGVYSRYRFTQAGFVHAGVFESNAQHYFDKRKGFDWDPGDASGVSVLAGVGSAQDFSQTPYAYHYELDGFYNSARQTDPLDGRERRGTAGVMFKFRQTLAREGHSVVPNKAWQWFGAWSWSADDIQPFEHFAEVGLTRLGAFDRPHDSVNLKASYLRLGAHQARWQQQARLAATGQDTSTQRNVSRIELNAHWQLTRNLALEPSVQYIFNPDNFYDPAAPANRDGAMIALQVMYDVGAALGL